MRMHVHTHTHILIVADAHQIVSDRGTFGPRYFRTPVGSDRDSSDRDVGHCPHPIDRRSNQTRLAPLEPSQVWWLFTDEGVARSQGSNGVALPG